MTDAVYEEVRAAFLHARDLPPGDRTGFLHSLESRDPRLRMTVERLLRSDQESSTFLNSPALARQSAVAAILDQVDSILSDHAAAFSMQVPQTVGRYRIISEVGTGGMGSVYEAEQREPVRRKVAIKLMRAGLQDREFTARFEAERHALARMEHPNIAQIFDGGALPDGRPYLVMELARGPAITRYCIDNKLDITARLRLFLPVCDAVHHAHQKAIIHRDLKPANVVVVSQKHGPPRPVVLDFGVAKTLDDAHGFEYSRFATGPEQLLGTPAYMSPEQAAGEARAVDTRSDVYSLGVLLYEMLCDRLPYDLQGLAAIQAARAIVERPPAPLSEFDPRLRGDLETIVLKAIEKEPARRYASATDLARDIERFLSDRPIEARPPSVSYLLAKFLRRNRGVVWLSSGTLLSLVVGLAVTTSLYLQGESLRRKAELAKNEQQRLAQVAESKSSEAEEQRRIAEREAERATGEAELARREAEQKTKFVKFITGVLSPASPYDPNWSPNRTLLEAAFEAAEQLDQGQLSNDSRTASMLHNQLAIMFDGLGRADEAVRHGRLAVDLSAAAGDGRDDRVNLLTNLARYLSNTGLVSEATSVACEAVDLCAAGQISPQMHAGALSQLGECHVRISEFDRAIELLQEAQQIAEAGLSRDHESVAPILSRLGKALMRRGQTADAEPLLIRAIEIRQANNAADGPLLALDLSDLAGLHFERREFAKALPLYERSLAIHRAAAGADHNNTISILKNIASCRLALGQNDAAIEILKEVVGARKRVMGENSTVLASDLFAVATAFHQKGEYAPAEPYYLEAIEVGHKVAGPDTIEVAAAEHAFSSLLLTVGRAAEAEAHAREALRVRELRLAPGHPNIAQSRNVLGGILIALERHDEAEPLLNDAWSILRDAPHVNPPWRVDCLKRMLAIASHRRDDAAAAEWTRQLEALKPRPLNP